MPAFGAKLTSIPHLGVDCIDKSQLIYNFLDLLLIELSIKHIIVVKITAKQLLYEVEWRYIMAEQVLIQFRADKALKQEVTEIYESLGMDLPTALRMFMNKSKMVKGVPFDVRLPENTVTRAEAMRAFEDLRAQASDLPEMTLEEINAEISAARAERKKR